MDLLCIARSANEEHNAKTVPTLIHGKDFSHPGTNPLKMFRRLNDPDKDDLASSNRAVGITRDEITNVRNLVSDSDAAGEEHDCAIRVHHVHSSVRTFCKSTDGEFSVWSGFSFGNELLSKSCAGANYVGHGCLFHGEDVLSVHGELFVFKVFFLRGPGDGEGVGLPEANGGHVEVCVMSGLEGPWTRHIKGDADGSTRK